MQISFAADSSLNEAIMPTPLRFLRDGSALASSMLGALVVIGWALDIEPLKRVLPNFVTMKANTALCFLFMAGVLWLSTPSNSFKGQIWKLTRLLLLAIVFATALLTLAEYIFGINIGIDELLFSDHEHRGSPYPPGRPSPITALNFLFIGTACLFFEARPRFSQAITLVVLVVSLLGFVGYVLRLSTLYGRWSPMSLALHTTIGFLSLSVGALVPSRGRGLTSLLVFGPSAISNRWSFLGAIFLPVSLGALILIGYRQNLYGPEFGVALFTMSMTVSLLTLFWITAEASRFAEEVHRVDEEQFRTLANAIPQLAWMADNTGHIFWYNRRWFDYTGTTLEDMAGWGWQKVHDPSALSDVLRRWNEAISSGEPFEMLFPLRGVNGEFREFLTRGEPLKDGEGRVSRWFGTNTDITEQRKIERELRRINRELEEFAYVASHDLQEPLRMVNIYSQMLVESTPGDPNDLNQYAGFVRHGVMRMESLIRDLLNYSRTIHREMLPVGSANLSASFSESLLILKDRIEESGAKVVASDLPIVIGDTRQLTNVFQNLISNALKYRRDNVAPQVHVTVKSHAENEVTIAVKDNGIGFEQRYAEQIFGLFTRLHKEEYDGTGVGLAICQRIIERYGGRIWAEGRPEDGATFFFSLPCRPE